jgi:hypothetical protein
MELVINSLLPVECANIIQLYINNLRTIKIQNVPITYFLITLMTSRHERIQ